MTLPRRLWRLVLLTGLAFAFVFILFLLPAPHPRISLSKPASRVSRPIFFQESSPISQAYPPASIKPLPTGSPKSLPRIQAPAEAFRPSPDSEDRRAVIRKTFKRCYDAYKEHAWMKDELMPISGRFRNPFGGWAATLVDSLDSLWIMGFREEFAVAAEAACSIDWSSSPDGAINLFETTIRHLGGLLSAYDLSGHQPLLRKALDLGHLLYRGFDTPNRMPSFWLNFEDAKRGQQLAGISDPSASPASLCLEFTRLSQLTGQAKFYDATDRVTRFLERIQNETALPGMWPALLNFRDERPDNSRFTLGALADSLYEYLPKMHVLLGAVDDSYVAMYRYAADTAISQLLFRPMLPDEEDILLVGDRPAGAGSDLLPEMQHLTCFAGAMFGLGGRLLAIDEHVALAERLARGCAWAYSSFPTGIMPEIAQLLACPSLDACPWDASGWMARANPPTLPPGFTDVRDPRYLLRPEAVESLFVLYRITGRPEWQDMAWDMFQSINRATETRLANAAIQDVTVSGDTAKLDSMESFWMAETLKYLYLIFSPPDFISLDDYVFNTEAHPFQRPS